MRIGFGGASPSTGSGVDDKLGPDEMFVFVRASQANPPSPAFRSIQGPELAERAGMRPCSRGRGVVQPVMHLGARLAGRLARLSKRLSPEVLTKCNRHQADTW
jgi:hypothetical protein